MAKGVHSKRRKRNQSIKRKILEEKLWRPRLEETSKRLLKRTFGHGDDSVMTLKKNAFRYPNDPEAVIPQAEKPIYIDRRSTAAKYTYLMKEMGSKHKNILKKTHADNLAASLKEAENRAEGKMREEEVIDLNKMVKYDEYGNIDVDQLDMDKFNIDDGNKKKNKKKNNIDAGMSLDVETNNVKNIRRTSQRNKKKKNKSYFIVNY